MLYSHIFEEEDFDSPRAVIPFILESLPVQSVIDIGCGLGTWLKVFRENGVEDITGVEAKTTIDNYRAQYDFEVIDHDLSSAFSRSRQYDLALCLEVAEHLSPNSARTLVRSLTTLSDYILFSAAIPGQGGQNHLNEQWPTYWQKYFSEYGFQVFDIIRSKIWDNNSIAWYYRQNMLLYVKHSVAESGPAESIPLDLVHPILYSYKTAGVDHILAGKIGPRRAASILWKSLKWRFSGRELEG